ncbi:hypothetical protein CEXT_446151 [Caerostris extrusa]|uniref:Secreted protein n=1 Tax=Caerostris extrusa TaxID=172846 RepID=A0AAV4YD39_CAEEX|nr:hypothetical protein CEXT_446151 [Caerostris extrusa]
MPVVSLLLSTGALLSNTSIPKVEENILYPFAHLILFGNFCSFHSVLFGRGGDERRSACTRAKDKRELSAFQKSNLIPTRNLTGDDKRQKTKLQFTSLTSFLSFFFVPFRSLITSREAFTVFPTLFVCFL